MRKLMVTRKEFDALQKEVCEIKRAVELLIEQVSRGGKRLSCLDEDGNYFGYPIEIPVYSHETKINLIMEKLGVVCRTIPSEPEKIVLRKKKG